MAIYTFRSPEGKVYELEGPPGASREQVIAALQYKLSQRKEPESGIIGAAKRGAESLIATGRTAIGSLTDDDQQLAAEAMERQQAIQEKYREPASLERVKEAYGQSGMLGGAGEVASQVLPSIAEQVPQLATMAASARAGAALGAAVPLPGATAVGAALGAAAPSYVQAYGANIERQISEQIARGEEIDVNKVSAALTAAPQAAIDVAGTVLLLGKTLIGTLLGETVEKAIQKRGVEATEKLAREKLRTTIGKGVGIGLVGEGAGEVTQQLLERAQAGLPITSPDAIQEYGETLYQSALLSPLGGVGRIAERQQARGELKTAQTDEEAAVAEKAAEEQARAEQEKKTQEKTEGLEKAAIDHIRKTGQHSAIGLAGALKIKSEEAMRLRQKLVDSGQLYKVEDGKGGSTWQLRSDVDPAKIATVVEYLKKEGAARNGILDITRAMKDAGTPVDSAEAAAIRNELVYQKLIRKDRNGKWQLTPREEQPAGEPVAGPDTGGVSLPVSPERPAGPTTPEPPPEGLDGAKPPSAPPDVGAPTVEPTLEPPVSPGYVRVYHSGEKGEGKTGRWVSTNREYAENYRKDSPLFYFDVPASDPRVNNPDYADQGVDQGFTFNFELTPEEATQLTETNRTAPEVQPAEGVSEAPPAESVGVELTIPEEVLNVAPTGGPASLPPPGQNVAPAAEATTASVPQELPATPVAPPSSESAVIYSTPRPAPSAGAPPSPPTPPADGPPPSGPPPSPPTPPAGGPPPRGTPPQIASNGATQTVRQAVGNVINGPPLSRTPVQKLVNWGSSKRSPLLRSFYGLLSMQQIGEIYANKMPSIDKLVEVIERRAANMTKRRELASKSFIKWQKILNRHMNAVPAFRDVVNNSTLDQIDVSSTASQDLVTKVNNGTLSYATLTPEQQKTYDLTKKFNSLPPSVRNVYRELRAFYEAKGNEMFQIMKNNITNPSLLSKIQADFASKRMKVYFPLFRQGEYWASYTDRNGEFVAMAFESPSERNQYVAALSPQERQTVQLQIKARQVSYKTVPPAGFLKDVVDNLSAAGVAPAMIDSIYETYLNYLPVESVRQQFRKRKGFLGFEEDPLRVFATMGPRLENQLNNMKYAKDIDDVMSQIKTERLTNAPDDMGAEMALDNVRAQVQMIQNPNPRSILDSASYISYMWYIAGNVSSALVNLSQMPIVVYPMLAAKYGPAKAMKAWSESVADYYKGGFDNNADFMPDWTFGANNNLSQEFKDLFNEAVKRSVIRRTVGQEIAAVAQNQDTTEIGNTRVKVEQGLGWIFQNSERANREVTLLMAYKLAREAGDAPDVARKKSIDFNSLAHGSALAETGPRLFQTGFGKLMFVFKRFAQSQIYLLSRLFKHAFAGATPVEKSIARKQLLGIFGMSYMLAGVQGMPLYGAAALLASMNEDEDEPLDWDAQVIQALGMMNYKGPVSYALQADIASRTGFNGLLWKDDQKRMEEIGSLLYMMEHAFGPAYGIYRSYEQAAKDLSEGNIDRAVEGFLPTFLRNGLKALRLAEEGALNRDGQPIVKDFNQWNIFMQTFGFNPLELAEETQRAGAKITADKQLNKRKRSLLNKWDAARMSNDREGMREIYQEMVRFNSKVPPDSPYPITNSTLQKSYTQRRKRENESVGGVYVPQKALKFITEKYAWENDPMENVEEDYEAIE